MEQPFLPEATEENIRSLSRACIKGKTNKVISLLNTYRYPIHCMENCFVEAAVSHLDVMKVLYDRGVNINTVHRVFGCGALYLACSNNHLEAVGWLVSFGELNLEMTRPNDKWTS